MLVAADGNPEKYAKALCGLRPRHGWGMDMFIDAECGRCVDAMNRGERAGSVYVDVPEQRAAASSRAYAEGSRAAYEGTPRSANPYQGQAFEHAHWLQGFDDFA